MTHFDVPNITRNLVSLPKFDVVGYSFKFENDCFGLYKCTCTIGCDTLYDDLYKLNIENFYVETLMTFYHIVGTKQLWWMNNKLTCDINVCDTFSKKWKHFQRNDAKISKEWNVYGFKFY